MLGAVQFRDIIRPMLVPAGVEVETFFVTPRGRQLRSVSSAIDRSIRRVYPTLAPGPSVTRNFSAFVHMVWFELNLHYLLVRIAGVIFNSTVIRKLMTTDALRSQTSTELLAADADLSHSARASQTFYQLVTYVYCKALLDLTALSVHCCLH